MLGGLSQPSSSSFSSSTTSSSQSSKEGGDRRAAIGVAIRKPDAAPAAAAIAARPASMGVGGNRGKERTEPSSLLPLCITGDARGDVGEFRRESCCCTCWNPSTKPSSSSRRVLAVASTAVLVASTAVLVMVLVASSTAPATTLRPDSVCLQRPETPFVSWWARLPASMPFVEADGSSRCLDSLSVDGIGSTRCARSASAHAETPADRQLTIGPDADKKSAAEPSTPQGSHTELGASNSPSTTYMIELK